MTDSNPPQTITALAAKTPDKLNLVNADTAEAMAAEVLSMVRDFMEVLRTEFQPQKQGQRLEDVPLYSRILVSIHCQKTSQRLAGIEEEKEGGEAHNNNGDSKSDGKTAVSSFHEGQRRRVLSEVALPLAELLANCYGILDDLPEDKPAPAAIKSKTKYNTKHKNKTKSRPAPPRGMLSIRDYTDVACLLEFIVYTGILPSSHEFQDAVSGTSSSSSNSNSKRKNKNNSNNNKNSVIEDRLRNKLPKSLAGRIPKDALRWGTSTPSDGNDRASLSLFVRATDTVTRIVVLDRFRPMLLPRHLVDIYGACFRIEYLAEKHTMIQDRDGNSKEIDLVVSNHYQALGLSLPSSLTPSSSKTPKDALAAGLAVVVDPTLRAMTYQTLLSTPPQPQGSATKRGGKKQQRQTPDLYYQWLQHRVSALLTDMATRDLKGLSAIVTVFVPVLSSSTDQTALMSGASQRLGRTLAVMTATTKDAKSNEDTYMQGKLCRQLLELLVVAVPMATNEGVPARSMAVIQTAWAFFEHLPRQTIEKFVLGQWASRLLGIESNNNSTGGIRGILRQVGALCAFLPPHSKSVLVFRRKAVLTTNDSYGDSTLLGQIFRVAMLGSCIKDSNSNSAVRTASSAMPGEAEITLLMLTQAIYVGSTIVSSSAADEEEEERAKDKVVANWISALGPTKWDLEGHSYVWKKVPRRDGSPVEAIVVNKHRPLLPPTPMEEFAASVQSTAARAEYFVEKVLLVLAPSSIPISDTPRTPSEEEAPYVTLQGLPSRIFRYLLQQYLSQDDNGRNSGSTRLVATVLLPLMCERCSQEHLLFGGNRNNASSLLLLIRQVLSELADAKPRMGEDEEDEANHRHEFLKSIAGILTSLLIALMEAGSKSRSDEEEDILQSFLPTLRSLSSSADTHLPDSPENRNYNAAMADMAAYAMALIASRRSSRATTDDNVNTSQARKVLRSPEDRLRDILSEAEKDLGSTQAPIRARGMVSLGRLARGFTGALTKEQKTPSLIIELNESGQELPGVDESMAEWIERVLELSMVALGDEESYVYLASIQTIVAVGDLHPRTVLPKIASAIVRGELSMLNMNANANDKTPPRAPIPLSQEQVIKLAEALIFLIRRRAVTDDYVSVLVTIILRGGTPGKPPTETTANPQRNDPIRIQQETHSYFATGRVPNGDTIEEEPDNENDNENALTKQELWEEQDIRLKTGGPIFEFEEADLVRSLRITILSELVASSSSTALVPHVTILARLAIESLHLEQASRIVQRSAALLARELYARVLTEATELADALGGIEDRSKVAIVPISIALVESDEEALRATLRAFASGNTTKGMVADATVVARCREAMDLREQADEGGVFLASKLVLEERQKLSELPALFRGLGGNSKGDDSNPVVLNPIETLR